LKRSFKKFVIPGVVCMYMQRYHVLEGQDETNEKHLHPTIIGEKGQRTSRKLDGI